MYAFESMVSVKYVNKYQNFHRFGTITEDIVYYYRRLCYIFWATCHRITREQKISWNMDRRWMKYIWCICGQCVKC